MESIFNKWCLHNWLSTCRRKKIDPYYHHAQNSSPNGLKPQYKSDHTEPDRRENGKKPLPKYNPSSKILRATINKWDLLKLRSFCKAKDTINKTKR